MRTPASGKVRIGTSGWQYPHFRGRFYPENVASADQLAYYARRFRAVELNTSFYHFTRAATFAKRRVQLPEGFEMAVKAHRSFTHLAGLGDPDDRLHEFVENASSLGPRLGPILFQLPPSFERDDRRLGAFIKKLPPGYRFTMEFRHPSWAAPAVYRALEWQGIAWCIYDIRARLCPIEVTAPFTYVRLHGPLPSPYRGAYSRGALERWAERLRAWSKDGIDSYVFFDNTMQGDAIDDARALSAMTVERGEVAA